MSLNAPDFREKQRPKNRLMLILLLALVVLFFFVTIVRINGAGG